MPEDRRHRLLLMLDEFPALGRLDFFESALAFMAGYGLKSFLIAQSLNQIEKAYGANNAILDNCHVRVAFATNDERTAKRVSDALGTATEMRAMTNYAGHRLSPWLGHLMVSRQETARPLLTPGEVMQLPPADELVLVSGIPPIRAKKARYYEDRRLTERVLPPPVLGKHIGKGTDMPADDWRALPLPSDWPNSRRGKQTGRSTSTPPMAASAASRNCPSMRRSCGAIIQADREFDVLEDEARHRRMPRARTLRQSVRNLARQAAMDPDDGIGSVRRRHANQDPHERLSRPGSARQLPRRWRCGAMSPGSAVVEAAVSSFLSEDSQSGWRRPSRGAWTDSAARSTVWTRISPSRRNSLALFVRFWLTITPPLPDSAQPSARPRAGSDIEGFVEALGRRFARGDRFIKEVSRDIPAARATEADLNVGNEQRRPRLSLARFRRSPPFLRQGTLTPSGLLQSKHRCLF